VGKRIRWYWNSIIAILLVSFLRLASWFALVLQRCVLQRKSLSATSVAPTATEEKQRKTSTGMPRRKKDPPETIEVHLDMTVSEFLGRVLVAAMDQETYEIRSVFRYGGNEIDFVLTIADVRPVIDFESLRSTRN
jgi:hypothetical protein